jgi:hypothetical protein
MSTSRRARSTQRAVAIAEQVRLPQLGTQPSRLANLMEGSGKPTRLQRKIAMETVTRAGSIEATTLLHEWGSQNIAHAHLLSQRHALHTFRQLNAVMVGVLDPETAKDMETWTTAQKLMYTRHASTLLDGTVANITRLVTEPLPSEEERPKGILGWLVRATDW